MVIQPIANFIRGSVNDIANFQAMDSGGLRYFTENGINPFPCVLNVASVVHEKRIIILDFCLFYSSVDLISQSLEAHPSFARPHPRCKFFRFSLSQTLTF